MLTSFMIACFSYMQEGQHEKHRRPHLRGRLKARTHPPPHPSVPLQPLSVLELATIVGGKFSVMPAADDAEHTMSKVEIGRPTPGPDYVAIDFACSDTHHSDVHTTNDYWGVKEYPLAWARHLGCRASGGCQCHDPQRRRPRCRRLHCARLP